MTTPDTIHPEDAWRYDQTERAMMEYAGFSFRQTPEENTTPVIEAHRQTIAGKLTAISADTAK